MPVTTDHRHAMRQQQECELHDHYARNAKARGHAATCALVTTRRNWPTICGRPTCTCSRGRH